jgi:TrmH family RNA methyltransferase
LEFKAFDQLKNRILHNKFIIEDALLVNRAINDRLPVEKIIHTDRFIFDTVPGVPLYKTSDGLLSSITSTRPLPSALAIITNKMFYVEHLTDSKNMALLITDNVSNPDNLGMILRTADAAGITAVIVLGEGAHPLHKNCIRAARGAVGRLPIICADDEILSEIISMGFKIIGTTAETDKTVYGISHISPIAYVVGNENHGIRTEILKRCAETVRIPMLPSRDSLSVAVAAGIIIYEWVRTNV